MEVKKVLVEFDRIFKIGDVVTVMANEKVRTGRITEIADFGFTLDCSTEYHSKTINILAKDVSVIYEQQA